VWKPWESLSADQFPLDNRERQSAIVKAFRNRLSGDATAETHDIEFLRQLLTSPRH
jgi:hypothetical protein